jgi:hypothetical protein
MFACSNQAYLARLGTVGNTGPGRFYVGEGRAGKGYNASLIPMGY